MADTQRIEYRYVCICCHQERLVTTRRNPTGLCHICTNRKGKTLLERFWEQVDKEQPCSCHAWEDRCWLWTGRRQVGGYGDFRSHYAAQTAHRFIYQVEHGPLPRTVFVLHIPPCILKHCVRHLYAGTPKQNMEDMLALGRHVSNVSPGETNPYAKLTNAQVLEMRYLYDNGIMTLGAIATYFAHSRTNTYRILKRKAWKHLP